MLRTALFFCWLVMTLLPIALAAQVRFEQVEIESAFSASIAYQLAQDKRGNIWVVTEEGLLRLNSHQSFAYRPGLSMPTALAQGIRAVHVSQNGTVWIGGNGGIGRYDSASDSFESIVVGAPGPTLIRMLVQGGNGRLWIAAFNGLWVYTPGEGPPVRLVEARNLSSLSLKDTDLVFGAEDGFYHLNTDSGKWNKVVGEKDVSAVLHAEGGYLYGTKYGELYWLSKDFSINEKKAFFGTVTVRDLAPGLEGGYYVGTDGAGVFSFDEKLNQTGNYSNDVNSIHSISSDGIYDLLTDREGVLWVATYGGGVNKLNPFSNLFRHLTHIANTDRGLAHPSTRAILEDKLGRIWFGTKDGISIWSREEDRWEHLLHDLSEGGKRIITGFSAYGDEVWVATYRGDLYRIDLARLQPRQVSFMKGEDQRKGRIFAIAHDPEGNLWIGGVNMTTYSRRPNGEVFSFPIAQVKVLVPTESGVWAGGREGIKFIQSGLGANSEDTGVIALEAVERYRQNSNFSIVNALLPTDKGSMYIGTNGAGLLYYDTQQDTILGIDAEHGLTSNVVQGLIEDNSGNLWATTSRGIARFKKDARLKDPELFSRADGLIGNEFNLGSVALLNNGKLLLGGIDGVNMLDPQRVELNAGLPEVLFEDFYLFNERMQPGQSVLPAHLNELDVLKLSYNQNSFTLHFAGVAHAAESKVRYRWQLSGLNERWSEPTPLRQVNFTNLSPGAYTFRVAAAVKPGEWGEVRNLQIIITPPWWKTWWAWTGYALLGMVAVYVGFRLSRSAIRRRNVEKQVDFFNNITHELKTPLAILLASLEDITEGPGKEGGEAVGKIRSTIKRLSALFEQLLNFHKASSAGKSRHVSAFSPGPHLRELVDRFVPLTRDRELKLRVVDTDAPEVFHCDKDIFDKIVFNLVSNAIKYSRPGGNIEVSLSLASGGDLQLRVKDEGIGIPADQQKHILQEYYRARNAVNSQLPGTGLGLMMVKNMVEKEGGSIRFESQENEGTIFYVRLADRKSDLPFAPKPAPSLPDTDRQPADADSHILLVEDNDELRVRLGNRLARHFKVTTAANGKEGLALAEEHFPDLIVTDLIMPEMDGMELSKAIQQDIKLNHIPVFLLTVLQSSDQKVASIAAGVSEYLEKPVNFDLLLAKINNTLNWRQRMRERYAAADEAELAAQHRTERENEFIGELESFALEHIGDVGFSVQDLCRHLGMSRTSLYMKMKNLIDLSPQDFIIHTRLKESRRMLTETEETIKTIAYDCGFSNPKYFSTSFKKKYGLSPGAFRKSLSDN